VTVPSLIGFTGIGLALAGYLVALTVHHAGRSPRLPLAAVAVGVGLVVGIVLVNGAALLIGRFQELSQPGSLATVLTFGAVPVVVVALARRGSRRIAGLFVTAMAASWLAILWSGSVEMIDFTPGGRFVLGAGTPVGLVVLAIGVVLAISTDPAADPRSPEVRARRRRIGAFGGALMGRARLGPLTPAIAATMVALAVSLDPRLTGVPGLLLPVTVALIASELELRLVPSAIRPALEAFHWVGRGELARFKAITGRSIPVTRDGAAAWLATPETEGDLEYRSELLVWLDRRAEALAVVGRMPERTPAERLQKALEADYVAWSADGHERGIDFAELLADVHGEPERLRAAGLLAYRASLHAFAAGDPDWPAPLAAHRARLGPAADGLHPRAMRTVTLIPTVGIAVILGFLTQFGPQLA
jgi:hypothetical protein